MQFRWPNLYAVLIYNKSLTRGVISSLNMCNRSPFSSRCSCNRTEVGERRAIEVLGIEVTAGAACS